MSGMHRDDLPMDVAEALVKRLQEEHPGCTVSFSGDSSDKETQAAADEFVKHASDLFLAGKCFYCPTEHPRPWPPEDEDADMAEGWAILTAIGESAPPLLMCPECNKRDDEEGDGFREIVIGDKTHKMLGMEIDRDNEDDGDDDEPEYEEGII